MKIFLTSGFLPKSNSCCCSLWRSKKRSLNSLRITILLFALTTLLTAQNVINPNALDIYKNFYIWQEKENFSSFDDSVITVLGRWAWGPCLAVDADSSFAYIGNGPTFHVLDISDPSKPEIVGEYLTEGYVYDIEIRNNVAFVIIGGWLLILDISNPLLPQKISDVRVVTNDAAISFALEDDFAYVTTFSGFMWVVDISDLNNPFKRGGIPVGGQLAFCVEAKDRYVYIGNPEWPPMVIVDATNPDVLTRVDFEVGGWGSSAYINDTLLFVGVRGYSANNYLKIYNVTNASEPEYISQLNINLEDYYAITGSKDGLSIYARSVSGKLFSIDITNITQPVILNEIGNVVAFKFGSTGISISGNNVLAAYYRGLAVFNVSQSDSIKHINFFPTGGNALELDSKKNLVFVACGLSGMWILDCSSPEKIKNIGNIVIGGVTVNILVDDTLAYIYNWEQDSETDTTIGLWIVGINNPYQPIVLTHYKPIVTISPPHSMVKSNNSIFITQVSSTESDTILEIIDISNVLNPEHVSAFTENYYPHNISIKDSVLYLATSDRGLRIIDISDIYNPYEINLFSDSSYTTASNVLNNLLFVDRTDTFFVLDISNPFEPNVLGRCGKTEQGSALNLIATKNYAYSAGLYLIVFDVSDKSNPKEVSRFESQDYGRDITISNDNIIFSDGAIGLWILKNNLVVSADEPYEELSNTFQLYQNYPNPFNSNTKIKFEIPNVETTRRVVFTTLKVYDILGNEVVALVNEEKPVGNYEIEFNAGNLSSGVYFYTISAGSFNQTKKMILLR
jgi:hypothetical protein